MSFHGIPLEIIRLDEVQCFDLYVRHRGGHVLFAARHTPFTEEHRARLLDAGSTTLFVRGEDLPAVRRYTAEHLEGILADGAVPSAKKAEIFYSSSAYTMQEVFADPRARTIGRMEESIASMTRHVLHDRQVMRELFTLTAHDYYTYTHCINVGIFASALAFELFGDDDGHDLEKINSGFFLHDIGKTAVPSQILNKPGSLDEQEWDFIRLHPERGYELLRDAGHLTSEAKHIVLEHHERHDGSGYPYGLSGSEIHDYARVCAIADVFDALTTRRSYRDAQAPYEALKIMQQEMAHEFDPDFFATFVLLFAPSQQPACREMSP